MSARRPLTGKRTCTRTHERRPTFYPGSRSTPPTGTSSGTSAPRPSSPVRPCDGGGGAARLGSAAAAVRCDPARLPGLRELVNECAAASSLPSLSPAPLLRAASHHYGLMMLLTLPLSWHADDPCHAALMTFFWRAAGGP